MLGADTVPLWNEDLPKGGHRRRPISTEGAEAVYFSACIGSIFGTDTETPGVNLAFATLAKRAGVSISTPAEIGSLCCGTPWKSKGLTDGYEEMAHFLLPVLWRASRAGEIPIVSDASSCTEGLRQLVESAPGKYRSLQVVDCISFTRAEILPGLTVSEKLPSLALHPTCSSTRLGLDTDLAALAGVVSDEVVIPESWGCCAFAGDRGMLHPELTASATAREAAEIGERGFAAYASTNRTCEIGMSRATDRTYRHILELLEEATR
jgi:D-lactate dehydrogenase